MLELTLLFSAIFFLISSSPKLRHGNPFQIYFGVWSLIIFLYGISKDSWIETSNNLWAVTLYSHAIWAVGLLAYWRPLSRIPESLSIDSAKIRVSAVRALHLICLIALPIAYVSTLSAIGGTTLLEENSFSQLRQEKNYGDLGTGWTGYLILPSFLVASLTAILRSENKIGNFETTLSISVAAGYALLTTGRTFIVLLFLVLIMPLILSRKISRKGTALALTLLFSGFILVTALTGKGISTDLDVGENIKAFSKSMRAYTVAPFVAFDQVITSKTEFAGGEYTFRSLYRIGSELNLTKQSAVSLVREYAYVPDATNVYTFHDPYYRDFGYLGLIFSALVMLIHAKLYLSAAKNTYCMFFYSISTYPLLMQFFQDQYFSLLSTWIQCLFWTYFMMRPRIILGKPHV